MKNSTLIRLLLPGLFLLLSLSLARAQGSGPYSILGPSIVCQGSCAGLQITGDPAAMAMIATVNFNNFPSTTPTFVNQAARYYEFCLGMSPLWGSYLFRFIITTTNGTVYIVEHTVTVVSCIGDLELESNAADFCPAGNTPDPPPVPNGFALFIGSENNVGIGQQVCLNVTAQQFNDIVGMQLTINYDPTMLQFVSVGNFNLQGLVGSNFATPGPGGSPPGTIILSWIDPDLGGETLPDGHPFFQLCFIALAGTGSTMLTFGNTPTAIEVINSQNQTVPFTGVPGTVTFGSGGPTSPEACEKVCAGTTVQYNASLINADTMSFFTPYWSVTGATSWGLVDNDLGLIEVTWGNPGTGLVRVEFVDQSAEICVNVLALPEAGFSADPPAAGDTLRLCRGQSAAFANTSQGGTTYLWQFGDGNSSMLLHPVYAWEEAPEPIAWRSSLTTSVFAPIRVFSW